MCIGLAVGVMLAVTATPARVPVFGFDDFCYDGICYDNPARDVALALEGAVVPVAWEAVEALRIEGPGLGIGIDPGAGRAYVNGSAFGLYSLAAVGPDAGDYECGHLFARLLAADRCSLFVHVPRAVSPADWAVVLGALERVRACRRSPRRDGLSSYSDDGIEPGGARGGGRMTRPGRLK